MYRKKQRRFRRSLKIKKMSRFWIHIFAFYILFMIYKYIYRFPLILFNIFLYTFWSGLQSESGLFCQLLVFLAVESSIRGCCRLCNYVFGACRPIDYDTPEITTKCVKNFQNAVAQTNCQWKKKVKRQDKQYQEVSRIIKEEYKMARKRRGQLVKKYKLKRFNIMNDTESKSKLLTSVNKKVVSLTLEIDLLMNRIQEKRIILDRQRIDNKHVLQRYEELYQDLQQSFSMYE